MIVFLSLFLPFKYVHAEQNQIKTPGINTWYAVVMDYDSGRVLFGKCDDMIVPMASTTKIMTAIVALENSRLDDIVTVSKRASSVGGSTVGLKEGQKMTMEQLLYGLMLQSGNDCAIAIAEHVGKSVEQFASMMTSKAFDIGAFDTHYLTPHGLDSDGHFTTAYDLALITRYALQNETFSKIVSTKAVLVEGPYGNMSFHNINKMLYSMEGADGVKTGYTAKAGKCLVSSVTKDGKRFISVTLNSSNRWGDSKKLLGYAIEKYNKNVLVDEAKHTYTIRVTGGNKKKVCAGIEGSLSVSLSDDEMRGISYKVVLPESITAPVYKNQQLGHLEMYYNDNIIYSIPIKSKEDIYKKFNQ